MSKKGKHLFTSESVTEGHPDKICDQISDAILDDLLKQDPYSRVACETLVTTGLVFIAGEITTKGYCEFQKIVRSTVREIGYINDQQRHILSKMYGERQNRALRAVEEGRVKKYIFQPSGRIVWIVVGKKRDYLVMPEISFCSCYDFYFQFDRGHLCYHIIAQKLAEAICAFDTFEDDDQLYTVLIEEWAAPDQ